MADYAAQASAIYDPQLAGEQATLKAEQGSVDAGFTDETNSANEAYNQALKVLGETEATGEARNNFTAANHGLASSGLVANAQRLTYGKYQEGVATTAQVRADKLAAVAGRKQAADQGYAAKYGALTSKYAGLKSQYAIEHQNADAAAAAKFQQEQQMAAERNAARAASVNPMKGYGVTRDSSGGYQFHGAEGEPITAAQYYAAKGGSFQDVFDFINRSSSNQQLKNDIGKLSQDQLAKKYPYIFGGV